ncbi:MAG: WD domain, G-beta repeat, partial [Phormidium sp. OSCR]
WQVSNGELIQSFDGHSSWVRSANFSPDGTQVVSASGDKTVKLWQVSNGELIQSFDGHSSGVDSANFSPDGTQVVSASGDGTVKLWQVNTRNPLIDRACDWLTP